VVASHCINADLHGKDIRKGLKSLPFLNLHYFPALIGSAVGTDMMRKLGFQALRTDGKGYALPGMMGASFVSPCL
jgi:hypothetical protein